MRWIVAFVSLAVPATGISSFAHELDYRRPPRPPPPLHDPLPPEPPVISLTRPDHGKGGGDRGGPPRPSRRTPARPLRSLPGYITQDDYPAAALRDDQQGQVRITLDVGPTGRVTDCRITLSSRSASLDQATCRIMRSRARFEPAHDAKGVAVAGIYRATIAWRLPEDFRR